MRAKHFSGKRKEKYKLLVVGYFKLFKVVGNSPEQQVIFGPQNLVQRQFVQADFLVTARAVQHLATPANALPAEFRGEVGEEAVEPVETEIRQAGFIAALVDQLTPTYRRYPALRDHAANGTILVGLLVVELIVIKQVVKELVAIH
jgi:hypothetical protein